MEEKIFDVEENKTEEQTESKASIKDTVEKAADKGKGFIKKMWSEKRILSIVVLVAFLVLIIAVSTAIAVSVRPEGDYYRYTYDAVKGEFCSDNSRIEINNNNRFIVYDNTGNIVVVGGIGCMGEYTPQDDGLNIRVENLGTVIYTKYYIKNGNYIIDPVAVIPQISDSIYTDKDKLEGYYNLNINGSASTKYLFKKKVYSSVNGTTDPASFTKEEGEYDQSGDFLTITNLSGI